MVFCGLKFSQKKNHPLNSSSRSCDFFLLWWCLGVRTSWGLRRYFFTWIRRYNSGFHKSVGNFFSECNLFVHASRWKSTWEKGRISFRRELLIISFLASYRNHCNIPRGPFKWEYIRKTRNNFNKTCRLARQNHKQWTV